MRICKAKRCNTLATVAAVSTNLLWRFGGFCKERSGRDKLMYYIGKLRGWRVFKERTTECTVGNWENSEFAELLMVSTSMLKTDKQKRKFIGFIHVHESVKACLVNEYEKHDFIIFNPKGALLCFAVLDQQVKAFKGVHRGSTGTLQLLDYFSFTNDCTDFILFGICLLCPTTITADTEIYFSHLTSFAVYNIAIFLPKAASLNIVKLSLNSSKLFSSEQNHPPQSIKIQRKTFCMHFQGAVFL